MTREEALKIIEATATDYSSKQRFVHGLNILAKYDNDIHPAFEHDQIWVGNFDETVAQMSREEIEEMARCGWFESEDAWSHF